MNPPQRVNLVLDIDMIERLRDHCQDNNLTILCGDPVAKSLQNHILKVQMGAEARDEYVISGEFNDRQYTVTKGGLLEVVFDLGLLGPNESLQLDSIESRFDIKHRQQFVRLLHERRG